MNEPDEVIPLNERIHSRHVMSELVEIITQFRNALEPTGMATITRRQFTVQVSGILATLITELELHGEGGNPAREDLLHMVIDELNHYKIEVAVLRDQRFSRALQGLRGRQEKTGETS